MNYIGKTPPPVSIINTIEPEHLNPSSSREIVRD